MLGKTKAKTPKEYIESLPEPRRSEVRALHRLITKTAPQLKPKVGSYGIGYGSYHYRYASGHAGQMCRMGFSPRKASLVLYLPHPPDRDALLARLGKHATGVGCLYIKKLADVDASALEALVQASWSHGSTLSQA